MIFKAKLQMNLIFFYKKTVYSSSCYHTTILVACQGSDMGFCEMNGVSIRNSKFMGRNHSINFKIFIFFSKQVKIEKNFL